MRNVVPLFTVQPTHCGYIHVLLFGDEIGVEHESRSGESRAPLKCSTWINATTPSASPSNRCRTMRPAKSGR